MAEVRRIPELRFPEFTASWLDKKLDDIAFRGTGHTPNKKFDEYYNGGIKWISLADSSNLDDGLITETKYEISESGIKNSSAVVHPKGTVILSRDAGVGKSAVIGEDMAVSQHFITWYGIDDELDNWFLYYKLQILKPLFERMAVGNTIKTIGMPFFKKLRIKIPKYTEQQKIASFLTAVDERIHLLQKKKDKLEEYKKGVMQKLFSQEIRFKDENGNDFPDWEEKKLGEVFNSKKGTGLSKNVLDPEGQFDCILYGELYTTYAEVIFEVESKTNDEGGTLSKQGDLLVPCSTTTSAIDLANVTALNEDNVKLGGDITILRAQENINNTFYAYYLSNYKKLEIAKYGQGTTIVHLYYNHFKVMTIDVPSIEEQQKIATFLTSLDESIESLGKEIEGTTTFKKGLLQKMFV